MDAVSCVSLIAVAVVACRYFYTLGKEEGHKEALRREVYENLPTENW